MTLGSGLPTVVHVRLAVSAAMLEGSDWLTDTSEASAGSFFFMWGEKRGGGRIIILAGIYNYTRDNDHL